MKNPQAFANKRLEDLKLHISKDKDKTFNAERQSLIACAQCTGAQVTELFCNGCDRWKGLDGFAKAYVYPLNEDEGVLGMEGGRCMLTLSA